MVNEDPVAHRKSRVRSLSKFDDLTHRLMPDHDRTLLANIPWGYVARADTAKSHAYKRLLSSDLGFRKFDDSHVVIVKCFGGFHNFSLK